jgi:hypothetical protein
MLPATIDKTAYLWHYSCGSVPIQPKHPITKQEVPMGTKISSISGLEPLWPTALDLAATADQWYDAGLGARSVECLDKAKHKLAVFTDVDAMPWPRRLWAKLEGPQAPTKLGLYFVVLALASVANAYIAYQGMFAPRPDWAKPSYVGVIGFTVFTASTLAFWFISVFNHWQARKGCQEHLNSVMAKHAKPTTSQVVVAYLVAHLEHKLPEDLFFAKQLMSTRKAAQEADESLVGLSDKADLRIAMDSVHQAYLNSVYGQYLLLDMRATQVRKCAADLMAKIKKAAGISEDDEAAETEEHISEAIKRLMPEINAACTVVGLAAALHDEGTCGKITQHDGWKLLTKAVESFQAT